MLRRVEPLDPLAVVKKISEAVVGWMYLLFFSTRVDLRKHVDSFLRWTKKQKNIRAINQSENPGEHGPKNLGGATYKERRFRDLLFKCPLFLQP